MIEGCDTSGKTTQVTRLNSVGRPIVMRRFPDQTTSIGTIINSYLGCKKELEDHVVHLYFPPTGGNSGRRSSRPWSQDPASALTDTPTVEWHSLQQRCEK